MTKCTARTAIRDGKLSSNRQLFRRNASLRHGVLRSQDPMMFEDMYKARCLIKSKVSVPVQQERPQDHDCWLKRAMRVAHMPL
jgi:hypothetical protein